MSNPSVSLKLLIDAKRGVVLFAETTENLAAVMYDMLSQSDTVISLLRQQDTAAGSVANLCKSIQNVDDNKSTKGIYCCGNCDYSEYSDDPLAVCSHCFGYMDTTLAYVAAAPPADGSGKAPLYIITDDLEIMPMSAVSLVTLVKRLGVEDVDALEEKVVDFGVDEAIKVVNASRQSKKVLTDVFLEAEAEAVESESESENEGLDEFIFRELDNLVIQWKENLEWMGT